MSAASGVQKQFPREHCGAHRDCTIRVARILCLYFHSPKHCRIWKRSEARIAEARVHVLAAPVPVGLDGIPGYTSFDACVAGRESGGDWTIDTGNGYYGAFQWLPETWVSVLGMMGETDWPADPAAASPAEQVAAFNFWSVRDPGAWPNSIPACGGP